MLRASEADSNILRHAARRGQTSLSLPADAQWLSELVPRPAAQLARMNERGLVERVSRGRYVILPAGATRATQIGSVAPVLVAALPDTDTYYLGYWSALAGHNLTDEESDAIYLAVRGPHPPRGLSTIAGRPVRMNRITAERKWFGAERLRAQGASFYSRSDLERTLIDTLDRPDLCGEPELWVRSWERAFREERVDLARLMDYAIRIGGNVGARTGFWLRELGRVRDARLVFRAIGTPLKGPRLLDASRSYAGDSWQRDRESGLYLNIPERAITGWLTYGK